MRPTNGILVGMVFLSVLLALLPNRTTAQPAESQVSTALAKMHHWIGEGKNAEKWRLFLKSEQLLEELKKGMSADRKTVEKILKRYSSDTTGLDEASFVKVRQALKAWLRELPKMGLAHLPQAARDAKGEFTPITEEDVERKRKELVQAINILNRRLARGTEENANTWKDYLRWSDMEAQLQADDGPESRTLHAIAAKYYQNLTGLELPEFTAVRVALKQYADAALLFSSSTKAQQFYGKYLEDLAGLLASYESQANQDEAVEVGKRLEWLERFGQAKELVTAVRQHHSYPNLFAQVSEDFLLSGMDSDIDERARVHDVILGTPVASDAHMQGNSTLNLVTSYQQGLVDVGMRASITSDSVGQTRQIRVYSTGVGTVVATKLFVVDAMGITDRPASAHCETSSTIQSVTGPPLIQRIATGRAQRDKPLAEAIGAQKAARRLERQMDEELGSAVKDANEQYLKDFRNPLIRRGGFPQILQFSSTEDYLRVRALQAGADQLGAPDRPPEVTDSHDMMITMHESFIANFSEATLGGETITDEDVEEWQEESDGETADESDTDEEEEPWSITFASERPVTAHFDDQRATISVSAKRFTSGDRDLKKNLRISAVYSVEKTPQGVKLSRQGDVEAEFVGKQRLKASEVALKTIVKKRFDAMFEPEFLSKGIKLPEPWDDVGELEFQKVYCDDGWMALSWCLPPQESQGE